MDDDSDDAQLVALPARNANGEGKEVVPEVGDGQSVAATVTVTVSRPEKVTYRGHTFVLESAISQRLKQLFMSLEVDAEEHVTLDQALYVCQHTDLPDVDIANMCGLVVPDKSNADTIACDEFVALMSMVCLAQQRGLESPRSLGELERLDGTVLVDVGLSDGDRTFAVEPPSHLELGEVRVDNIKSRSSGSGIYRHILYDITFSLGYGWDHVGINRTRVQRRYSDFVWLQERFLSKYAAVILPPLPAKKMVGNLDAQFVESRRQALEFYLNRIGEHTLLRSSLEFCVFISSTPRGMDALHKFCAPLKTTSWSESAKGLVSSVWSTFGNYVPLVGGGGGGKGPAADSKGDSANSASGDHEDDDNDDAGSSSASTALAVVAAAPTAVDQQDRGFAKMHEKFATCHAHLQRILGRTEDLTKHRRSMGLQVAFLGHAVSEIGAAEKSMRLRGTEGISLVGELLEKVAKLEQDTNDSFEATHVAQLKFHLGTLDMAQALLESRKDLFQQEREAYRKRLAAKKAYAAARAGGSSGGAAADSKQRAEREIQDSVQRVTAATRGIEKEVGRFEASKANNLRAMLQATADVMQQSNLRQKLLWADLARVLSTLSFQNGGGGSGGANSASSSTSTSSASSAASAGGGSGGGSIGSGAADGGRGGRAGDDDSTSRSSTPIYSDDSGSSQYE